MQTRIEKIEKEFRERWFLDHEATHIQFGTLPPEAKDDMSREELIWSKPETGIMRVIYICRGNCLFVCGALGEAVYVWGSRVRLSWIANNSYDYFAGKCQASEVGLGFKDWDADIARSVLAIAITDPDQYDNEQQATIAECMDSFGFYGSETTSTREEWWRFLAVHGDECFGDAWCEWAPNIGTVIHRRCMAHLYGLKMAFGVREAKA